MQVHIRMRADQRELEAVEATSFFERYGVRLRLTTAYNPKANGKSEGGHPPIINALVKCRSTKTQVNPSSALNRTKHHQNNPSNVPGTLDSNLSKRARICTSKSFFALSNRISLL